MSQPLLILISTNKRKALFCKFEENETVLVYIVRDVNVSTSPLGPSSTRFYKDKQQGCNRDKFIEHPAFTWLYPTVSL